MHVLCVFCSAVYSSRRQAEAVVWRAGHAQKNGASGRKDTRDHSTPVNRRARRFSAAQTSGEPHAVDAPINIYKNLLRVAVEELPHDVARLLGLLRVDPVAAVGDRLERKPRELRTDLLEVDGADIS